MAVTAQLHLADIILKDGWPGLPNANQGIPTGGWDNTTDNFTTTSANQVTRYPVGTKITMLTDNSYCSGNYTMQYLMFHDYSAKDISADFSDGEMWCCHYDGSDAEKYFIDFSHVPYYVVTRCYTGGVCDATRGLPLAIPCATIASDGSAVYVTGYGDAYGWFWVGGVCPCADATLLQGTAGTLAGADVSVDTLMRKGPFHAEFSGASIGLFTCDLSNFGDSTDVGDNIVGIEGIGGQGYACVSAV